jgi:hypothetical protein
MAFADKLKTLPGVSHLAALQLLDAAGEVVATIENKPGQAGSLAVYNHLGQLHGAITPRPPPRASRSTPSTARMRASTRASTPTSTA